MTSGVTQVRRGVEGGGKTREKRSVVTQIVLLGNTEAQWRKVADETDGSMASGFWKTQQDRKTGLMTSSGLFGETLKTIVTTS